VNASKAKKMATEKIFKPRYEPGIAFAFPVMAVAECVLLIILLFGQLHDIGLVYLAALFGIALAVVPFLLFRRIRFGATAMVIDRFILPSRSIGYHEIYDLGRGAIKTRQGNIPLEQITNTRELLVIFDELISQGKFSRHQFEGKLIARERLFAKAGMLSLPIAIPIALTAEGLKVWPNWSWLTGELRFWVVWLAIYFLLYWYLKYRAESCAGRN
jgi:hypothetical protein